MSVISKILFPVDFSALCVAMGPSVQRAAAIFNARVTLVHVIDPASYNGFEIISRAMSDIEEDHRLAAEQKLAEFLADEFPAADSERIVATGDAATRIARIAREGAYGLIMMPTHAGIFRQMLLGSTAAKVLNDADIPVLTSRHAETLTPRPLGHREWLCAIGLSADSERVVRHAARAAAEVHANLTLLHAIPNAGLDSSVLLDVEEHQLAAERAEAAERIAELQRKAGSNAKVRIVIGPVKEALIEAARRSDADALILGRNPHHGGVGRLRDLTYSMIRDSPFPVLSL